MDDSKNGAAVLAGSPGNDEVIKILAKYLASAKAGNYIAIGIVLVSGPDAVSTEYGGARGCEFAMNFGVDYLKDTVIQGFVEKMHNTARGIAPPHSSLIVPGRG